MLPLVSKLSPVYFGFLKFTFVTFNIEKKLFALFSIFARFTTWKQKRR